MQLVIDIPKTFYNDITKSDNIHLGEFYSNKIVKIIKNGTPLPKGHGRLCDLDAALKCIDNDTVEDCDAKWQAIRLFSWAMAKRVVIEADAERENKK